MSSDVKDSRAARIAFGDFFEVSEDRLSAARENLLFVRFVSILSDPENMVPTFPRRNQQCRL